MVRCGGSNSFGFRPQRLPILRPSESQECVTDATRFEGEKRRGPGIPAPVSGCLAACRRRHPDPPSSPALPKGCWKPVHPASACPCSRSLQARGLRWRAGNETRGACRELRAAGAAGQAAMCRESEQPQPPVQAPRELCPRRCKSPHHPAAHRRRGQSSTG